MSVEFTTMRAAEAAEVTAPDGSAVRPLCVLPGAASFAQFELAPGQVSKAVSHATVQEIWYVVAGGGQMWRGQDGRAEVTPLDAGVCLTIPLGTAFQFRAGQDGLRVVAATIPPWPDNPGEARPERGPWLSDPVEELP
jgi:mannose-6-phosphate isomerase-like protein (cupin superfamily)